MNKKSFILYLLIIIALSLSGEDYKEGEVIFKASVPFRNIELVNGVIETDQEWFNQISNLYQINELELIFENDPVFTCQYKASFNDSIDVMNVVTSLEGRGNNVIYAEPNFIFKLLTNDPLFPSQWALSNIEAENAWQITSGDNDILIAVLDSGIDFTHPDFQGNNIIWNENGLHGINPFYYGDQTYDWSGHGTMVSGIIRAITENNTAIAGLAGGGFNNEIGCKILPIRISGFDPNIIPSNYIAYGIRHVVDEQANVINMSLGGSYSDLISEVIDYAYSFDIVMIASAGNGGDEVISFPASHPYVLSVGATDSDDKKSNYSQYSPDLDVCAPGGFGIDDWQSIEDVVTLSPSYDEIPNYTSSWYYRHYDNCPLNSAFTSGTSISAPYVSALAGLILSMDDTLTPDQIYNRIKGTSDRIAVNSPNFSGKLGAGRINAYRALTEDPHPSIGFVDLEVDFGTGGDHEANVGDTDIEIRPTIRSFWMDYDSPDYSFVSDDEDIIIETTQTFSHNGIITEEPVELYSYPYPQISIAPDAVVGWHSFTIIFTQNNYNTSLECPIYIYPENSGGGGGGGGTYPNGYVLNGINETSPLVTNINFDEYKELIFTTHVENYPDQVYFIDHPDGMTCQLLDEGDINIYGRPAAGDLSRREEILYDEVVIPGENGDIWVLYHDDVLRGKPSYPNQQYHTTFGNDPLYVSIGNVNDDEYNEVVIVNSYNELGIFSWDYDGQDYELNLIENLDFDGCTFFPATVGDIDCDGIDDIIISRDGDNDYGGLTRVYYDVNTSSFESEIIPLQKPLMYFVGNPIIANAYPNNENEIFFAYEHFDNADLPVKLVYKTVSSNGSAIDEYLLEIIDGNNPLSFKRFSGCYVEDFQFEDSKILSGTQDNVIMFNDNLTVEDFSNCLHFSDIPVLGVNSFSSNNSRYFMFSNEEELIITDDNFQVSGQYHLVPYGRITN